MRWAQYLPYGVTSEYASLRGVQAMLNQRLVRQYGSQIDTRTGPDPRQGRGRMRR
jgi:hypothetical protein